MYEWCPCRYVHLMLGGGSRLLTDQVCIRVLHSTPLKSRRDHESCTWLIKELENLTQPTYIETLGDH